MPVGCSHLFKLPLLKRAGDNGVGGRAGGGGVGAAGGVSIAVGVFTF